MLRNVGYFMKVEAFLSYARNYIREHIKIAASIFISKNIPMSRVVSNRVDKASAQKPNIFLETRIKKDVKEQENKKLKLRQYFWTNTGDVKT